MMKGRDIKLVMSQDWLFDAGWYIEVDSDDPLHPFLGPEAGPEEEALIPDNDKFEDPHLFWQGGPECPQSIDVMGVRVKTDAEYGAMPMARVAAAIRKAQKNAGLITISVTLPQDQLGVATAFFAEHGWVKK